MRTIPARLSGFTPLMDSLLKDYDLETAVVWGRVWRYEQGELNACQASQQTIADETGLGLSTVIRRLRTLITDGYIIDHTPSLKNKPHTYTTTNKIFLDISISAMSERHSAMSERHSEYVRETDEDTIKKQRKKQSSSPDGEKPKSPHILNSERMERVFSEARGCPLPDWEHDPKGSNKRWRTPLNTILKKCEGDIEAACYLIEEITREMRKQELTFDAPDQIIKTVSSRIIDKRNKAGQHE